MHSLEQPVAPDLNGKSSRSATDVSRNIERHDEEIDCTQRIVNAPLSAREAIAICDGVIDLLAALFSVSGKHLRSPKRHGRSIARVRQIGMYAAHVTLGMRMIDVATGFGRDKSTVMYACHLIEDLRDDVEFNRIVARAEDITRIAFRLHRGCN